MDYYQSMYAPSMVPNVAPYGAAQQQAQINARENWLTPEQVALLQSSNKQFSLDIDEKDLARAQCRHMYNHQSTLVQDPETGGWVCTLCGQKFSSHDWTPMEIKQVTDNMSDILNMIKVMYLSMDKKVGLQFFGIAPLIEKIPQLYEAAANDFKKYEGVNAFTTGPSMNPFALFNRMMNPGVGYMYGQPMYGQQPMGAPAPMGAAPAAAPAYGYPQQPQAAQAPGFNPMYGAPQAPNIYQPQANGFMMNPQGASAPMGAPMYGYTMPQQGVAPAAAPQPQGQAGQPPFNSNMPIQPTPPQNSDSGKAPAAPTPASGGKKK